MIIKCKEENHNFVVKKSGKHHLNQMTKLEMGQIDIMSLLLKYQKRSGVLWDILDKNVQPEFNPNWEIFYKITSHTFSKHQGHKSRRNSKELLQI